MSDITRYDSPDVMPARQQRAGGGGSGESLADVLERVLDKGLVIAGDVRINLLDIELLTIKIRLLIASADKAREMGIDWWTSDPDYSSKARLGQKEKNGQGAVEGGDGETKKLNERLDRLEARLDRLLEHVEPRARGGGSKRAER